MDFLKENKFLSGFLGVTLGGAAVLGVLLLMAKGKHTEALDAFNSKASELKTLQNARPYPEEENFKRMEVLQKAHQKTIDDLQRRLAANEFPVEPLTPERFQDNLRDAVNRVRAKAQSKGAELPDNFYLGYAAYQAGPPTPDAAPQLGRMVRAIEAAITGLIDAGVVKIEELKVEKLPEEGGKPAPGADSRRSGERSQDGDSKLVQRYPFEITFAGKELAFRTFINGLITSKEQFYIPISVVVKNEQPEGPPKVLTAALAPLVPDPVAPAAPPAVDPGTGAPTGPDIVASSPNVGSAAAQALKFVVGEENLQVTMRIEVVDFAELPSTAAK
jgi:hypothetical protein